LIIDPGEGFWIKPGGPTPLSVTFVGEVPQGSLSKPLAGGNNFNLVGSQVPQALPLGSTGEANTLEFPAVPGDSVYIFDSGIQNYKSSYDFFEDFGWSRPIWMIRVLRVPRFLWLKASSSSRWDRPRSPGIGPSV
jgi:hypothetical protein